MKEITANYCYSRETLVESVNEVNVVCGVLKLVNKRVILACAKYSSFCFA